jgi:hypothetical protein
MAIAIGAWIAVAGALALLAGTAARRRVRRLRISGVKVWATAVHRPIPDHRDGGQRVYLQYVMEDGRVLERLMPPRRAARLPTGEKVLVWYDPKDPADVLVYGNEGHRSDLTLIIAGLVFVVIGSLIAVLTPSS